VLFEKPMGWQRVEEYFEKVDNANLTMEASFESVCDFVYRKADRKLAYGLF
jgi:hypothetical protein